MRYFNLNILFHYSDLKQNIVINLKSKCFLYKNGQYLHCLIHTSVRAIETVIKIFYKFQSIKKTISTFTIDYIQIHLN